MEKNSKGLNNSKKHTNDKFNLNQQPEITGGSDKIEAGRAIEGNKEYKVEAGIVDLDLNKKISSIVDSNNNADDGNLNRATGNRKVIGRNEGNETGRKGTVHSKGTPEEISRATEGQLNQKGGISLNHFSKVKFDTFDSSYIGSGIGRQAGGHGFSFIDDPDYAKNNPSDKLGNTSYRYEVKIKNNNFLRSDKAPTFQQLIAIGEINGIDFTKTTPDNGIDLYDMVARSFGDWDAINPEAGANWTKADFDKVYEAEMSAKKKASEYLSSKGITGNLFSRIFLRNGELIDTGGRGNEYTVFNPPDIEIKKRTKYYLLPKKQ